MASRRRSKVKARWNWWARLRPPVPHARLSGMHMRCRRARAVTEPRLLLMTSRRRDSTKSPATRLTSRSATLGATCP